MKRLVLALLVLSALAVGAFLALPRPGVQAIMPVATPTITVNSTADSNTRDSVMTLREAILLATGGLSVDALTEAECGQVFQVVWDPVHGFCVDLEAPGAASGDRIVFDADVFPVGNPSTITLADDLPTLITGSDTIDGSSAGVIVDGVDKRLICFSIAFSDSNTIKGLQIINCEDGVFVQGANNTIGGSTAAERNVISGNYTAVIIPSGSSNTVQGNYIGTDAAGTAEMPNNIGVYMSEGAHNNTIGGTSAGQRNVISGNGVGVVIGEVGDGGGDSDNTVSGNYIGTDAAGTAAIPNGTGVSLRPGAQDNTIGGGTAAERNVISGNGQGVFIEGGSNNTVKGNYIGTDAAGSAALGNQTGVYLSSGGNNMVGGSTAAERNVISGNNTGVLVIQGPNETVKGNYIGTNAAGTAAIPNGTGVQVNGENNTIGGTTDGDGNVIAFNTGDGVYVNGVNGGATGNTIRGNSIYSNGGKGIDNANGGNLELTPPAITGFGSVMGTACPNCTIDIYSDDEDEGRVYEGSTTADNGGDWTFDGSPEGPNVTATATDAAGNTSEFSAPVVLPEATPTPTPTPTPTATPGATPTPAGLTRTLQWGPGWNNATWSGAGGTAPQDVFACAAGKFAAAYRFTGAGLERLFPGRPDISNMQPLAQYDAFLILITQPVTCFMPVAPGSPPTRTLQWSANWQNDGWSGADATTPQDAFACADGSYAAAYRFTDAGLERYFPDRPDISNMAPLNKYDAFLMLVTAPVSCTMPIGP
jgi:parallel beta-helix repeat protein